MGAGHSVTECVLMGIQQTHEPKKAVRWRSILKLARKGGTAPRLQSFMQRSLRFFAALLGAGLFGLSKRPRGCLETTGGSRLGIRSRYPFGRALSISQDVRLEKGVYLRYQRPFLVP